MRYFVPQLEMHDEEETEKVLELKKSLDGLKFEEGEPLTFDFSRMRSFEPAAMLIYGSVIRRFCAEHPETGIYVANTERCSYAGTMGFFAYSFPWKTWLNRSNHPGRGGQNYVPITEIDVDRLQKEAEKKGEDQWYDFEVVLEREAPKLAEVLVQDQDDTGEMKKLFQYLIFEIMRNVREHSHTRKLWFCGQYWPTQDDVEIAVVDEGIGILKSLTGNAAHKEIKDNTDALQWALRAGISESFSPSVKPKDQDGYYDNSGYGLYITSHICRELDGVFCLASGGNYIKLESGRAEPEIGEASFDGTAVQIRIRPSKLHDYQSLVDEISRQGEEEAKDIRGAFKEASGASRGTGNRAGRKDKE